MAVTRLTTIFETFEFEPEAVWSFVTTIAPIGVPPIFRCTSDQGPMVTILRSATSPMAGWAGVNSPNPFFGRSRQSGVPDRQSNGCPTNPTRMQ